MRGHERATASALARPALAVGRPNGSGGGAHQQLEVVVARGGHYMKNSNRRHKSKTSL
jgi:hypothetical protein